MRVMKHEFLMPRSRCSSQREGTKIVVQVGVIISMYIVPQSIIVRHMSELLGVHLR